jgi:hypothetical protein
LCYYLLLWSECPNSSPALLSMQVTPCSASPFLNWLTPCKSISSHSKLPNFSTSFLLQNYCLLNRIIFADKWSFFRSNSWVNYHSSIANNYKETQLLRRCSCVAMCASHSSLTTSSFGSYEKSKRVWIWTKSKEVMTAAVERGWNTFIFSSQHRQLANEWTCKLLRTSSCSFVYLHYD